MKRNFHFTKVVSILFSLFFFSALAETSLAQDTCERIEITNIDDDSLFRIGESNASTPVFVGGFRDFAYELRRNDLKVENDMVLVTTMEFSSVLASHGGLFQIDLLHTYTDNSGNVNEDMIASWSHYVSSTIFETYTHSVTDMNLRLSVGDTITYRISGITGPSPIMGSIITGESVGRMYTSPCYQEQGEFYGLRVWAEIDPISNIETRWREGGRDETDGGDRVVWGYFYAENIPWGHVENPEVFVKIWFDRTGRIDVNFFHVSVPEISVHSRYDTFNETLDNETLEENSTVGMMTRYIRHCYEGGNSYSDERGEDEDENPPDGYLAGQNPGGRSISQSGTTLRIGSVINTVESGPIEAIFREGGRGTPGRDVVIWGYFYATGVNWASIDNPELFVKLWYDASGRIDVNFFHVSVPEIEVYSDYPNDETYDRNGITTLNNRYIRHEY